MLVHRVLTTALLLAVSVSIASADPIIPSSFGSGDLTAPGDSLLFDSAGSPMLWLSAPVYLSLPSPNDGPAPSSGTAFGRGGGSFFAPVLRSRGRVLFLAPLVEHRPRTYRKSGAG